MNFSRYTIILLVYIILSLVCIKAKANDNKQLIDSLKLEILKTSNDSALVRQFSRVSYLYRGISSDSALFYIDKSIEIARKAKIAKGTANGYYNKGYVYYQSEDFDNALKYYLSALEIYIQEKDTILMSSVYTNLGILYSMGFDQQTAINYYLKSLELSQQINDSINTAYNLNNISLIYRDLKNYDKAVEYLNKALEIVLPIGDQGFITNLYNNLARTYLPAKEYDKTLINLNEALKRIDLDTKIDFKIEILSCAGEYYLEMNNPDSAIKYIRKAIDVADQANRKRTLAYTYFLVGRYFMVKELYPQSIIHITEAIKLTDSLNVKENIDEYYEYISKAYVKLGDLKNAYLNLQKSYSMKDSMQMDVLSKSLNDFEKEKEFIRIQSEFKFEQQKQQSEFEKAELKKISELENTRLFALLLIISIIALIITSWLFYKLSKVRKKRNQDLTEKNTLIQSHSDELNEMVEELQSITDNLNIANKTKSKLLSIIGHDLKNPFNIIQGYISILNDSDLDEEERKIYYNRINNASDQLLDMVDGLVIWSKTQTDKIQFNPVKTNICEISNQSISPLQNNANIKNIEIVYEYDKNKEAIITADPDMLKRIIHNLLVNAIKFTAKDGKIFIGYELNDSFLTYWIKDTGVGMEPKVAASIFDMSNEFVQNGTDGEKGTGLGLNICSEFIKYHKGKIWAESIIDEGTSFIFEIPIK